MPGIDEFNAHSERLVFVFDNKKAANHFKIWLSKVGEQDYWDWMKVREKEQESAITGLNFNYHTGTDEILVKCGRIDSE